jgi:hypothetical protein
LEVSFRRRGRLNARVVGAKVRNGSVMKSTSESDLQPHAGITSMR